MASTALINITELAIRFIVGLAIFHYAPESNFPDAFRIIGSFLAVTAILILAFPRQWHAAYAQWWARRLPVWIVPMVAPLSFAAGVFFIFALT